MKKYILTAFFGTSVTLLPLNISFADPYTISLGMPQNHTFNEKKYDIETDGSSGYFLGLKFSLGIGLGIDRYKTKLNMGNTEILTEMYNIFYQFPIPVLNITIGLGSGKSKLDCRTCDEDNTDEDGKKTGYKIGSASQWYTSLGIQLNSFLDIHVSYRSLTSKKILKVSSDEKIDFSGNVTGIGLAINF